MGVRRYHVERDAIQDEHIKKGEVGTEELADGAVTKAKISETALQCGRTPVSLPFAAAGEENVSVSITFPTAFAAAPVVTVAMEGADVGIARIAVTASDFTVTVRDDKGTDYTTSQTAWVNWIAVAV